jgi:hypothetical protein
VASGVTITHRTAPDCFVLAIGGLLRW